MSFLVVLVCALINGQPACSMPIQTIKSAPMTNSACVNALARAVDRVKQATVSGVAYSISCKAQEANA